ncbi:MAG: hypothetical protein IT235_07730 [Bacteroidia bacterium]|nr:hypothetical protein [Bacteroidia bacterium]
MKGKLLLPSLFLLFISSTLCYSQLNRAYYNFIEQKALIDKADSLPEDKAVESIALYEKANLLSPLDDWGRFTLAYLYTLTKNKEEAFKNLRMLIGSSKFYFCNIDTTEYCLLNDILTEKVFDFIHDDPQWDKTIEMIKKEAEKDYDKLNKVIVKELKEMCVNDQKYRIAMLKEWNKKGSQHKIDSLFKLQNKLDSANFKRLKEITQQYGWPGYKNFGRYSEILVAHNTDYNFYLPLMINAAKNNDLEWVHVYNYINRMTSDELLLGNKFPLDEIQFKNNSSELMPDSKYQLETVTKTIKYIESVMCKVELNFSYNNKADSILSKQRLSIITQELKSRGVTTPIMPPFLRTGIKVS